MLKRALLLPALCLSALLLAPSARGGDVPMTKLTIHVKSPANRPIDRASVVVRFVEGRSVIKLGKEIRTTFELRTNQEGDARIPEIPKGKILIQVIAKGYQTFGQTYDVSENEKTIEVSLNPPQQQYSAHE